MRYTEGHTKLYHAWDYLLKTYKVDGELPEAYWDAEELLKELIHSFVTDEIEREKILALYRRILDKIHFESGNVFYNKPGLAVYVQIAKLASDLRRA